MSKKISNDENIENLKKRKILRWIIMLFALLTASLSRVLYKFSAFFIKPSENVSIMNETKLEAMVTRAV